MGPVTLSKQNRLFWLGRYAERVYATVQQLIKEYDSQIDGIPMDYADFCCQLGIENVYTDAVDFCRRFLFDDQQPSSIRSNMDELLGNGMVLRETISSPTLAYLQMADSAMTMASRSDAPVVALQWVLDDLMAFWGSFERSVDQEEARNITKAGSSVERLSLMLRLDEQEQNLKTEAQKLLNRLYKTDLTTDTQALKNIISYAIEDAVLSRSKLLSSVEGLFII